MTSYVDYYKKHNVCPVFNIIDPSYLKKRAALYYQMGIVPALLKDKTVLEFGPGNGINSIYTQSLEPKEYVLVDANPKSLENCEKNFKEAFPESTNYRFVESLIDDFQSDQKFDVVICEGLIPHQHNPSACARKAASFTRDGGLFIHTCHDFISFLSERLRSFIAYIQSDSTLPFNERVSDIALFLKDHFTVLKAMSRTHEDWVIDSTMQTEHWHKTPLFSIRDSIDTFKDEFVVFGTSPSFISDLRWYKNLTDDHDHFLINDYAQTYFWEHVHNFIDTRYSFPKRKASENQALYQLAIDIQHAIDRFMTTPSNEHQTQILSLLDILFENVNTFSKETALAILCFKENLHRVFNKEPTQFKHFHTWWGRGMQFISLLKVS